jgi:putative addiction module killer protein
MQTRQTEAFRRWLARLRDERAKAKIAARVARIEAGNLGQVRPVGDGVSEAKIDYGPGYRLYFTTRRQVLIVLLIGGDKDSQKADIRHAKELVRRIAEEGITEEDDGQNNSI